MGVFSFSFYKTYYYFIFAWILDILLFLDKSYFDSKYLNSNSMRTIIELFNLICLNIGDLLAGFFVLYTYKSSQSEKDKSSERSQSNHIELIYNDLSVKENKNFLIFSISVLELIARSADFFYFLFLGSDKIRDGEITWLVSIDILSRIVFSHYLFNQNLYKHHKLSIYLTVLGLCAMSINAFLAINGHELVNWPYFIFIGTKFMLFALEDVINKLLLINKFLLPQTLMFWRGINNFFMLLILVPVFFITKSSKYKFDFDTKGYNLIVHIALVLFIIPIVSLKSFLILKIIYIFTPQHVSFLNVVFYMLRLLRCRIYSKDKIIFIVTDIIILLMIIFSTLTFNEMIIINACGMGENTKDGFLIKEKKELKEAQSLQYRDIEELNESGASSEYKK